MDPITIITIIGVPLLLFRKKKVVVKSPVIRNPKGKGLFIRYLTTVSREKFLSDIKALNLNWIAVLTHWQTDEEYSVKTKEYLDLEKLGWLQSLADSGIKIWFWGFPSAYDIDNFIEISKKYEKYKMCKGYIFNAEKSFLETPNAGSVLANTAKKRLTKPVGLASYGGGDIYVKDFPWDAFKIFDFGLPQIYDKEGKLGPDYPKLSFNSWKTYFKKVIPLWTISEIHTIEKLKELTNNTPNADGYAWWDYELLKDNPERFEFVKKFKWKGLL